ncbi:hypothetical protein SELMODRAFT_119072 [Selaginella moellendorffii]|uniref:Uncharacterized protein n=1 Tax=Selaginella moellendorffii TaxID=88036 RepID=D8SJW3_SELML|nr:cytokinin hydroxylase [Selaginella moellendorffii]EFJ15234.1 hypothetical protein SELMODRAFT_119072 [Selaginella moellendorffii]|eukprot:XP_002983738.1 cytokinin hydroxylase [Selaginella moellendorffii]
MDLIWNVVTAGVSLIATICVWQLARDFLWRPRRLLQAFKQQGVLGPVPRLFLGNLDQVRELMAVEVVKSSTGEIRDDNHGGVVAKVLPYYAAWSRSYGETFLVWWGSQPRLMISDPELMKEVLCDKSGSLDRDPGQHAARDLFGDGIALLTMNERWSQKRKMVSLAFHNEKLKLMIDAMVACVEENLKQWKTTEGPVDVASKLRDITQDVLCRTAFGTSYAAGKEVFEMQIEQQYIHLEWQGQVHLPGFRFLPTSANRRRWTLKQQIDSKLRKIVVNRLKESSVSGSYGKDLLGLMLAAKDGVLDFNNGKKLDIQVTMQDVIDECKTFFFTGQETSAALLAWTMLLLALNPDWQTRLRQEVCQVCGQVSAPNTLEMLGNLKSMTMVINEALRMYPPVPLLNRYTHNKVKLKELVIPKGTLLLVPLIVINYNEKFWGVDAKSFNPDRFVSQQQRPFLPFSVGPRTCVGQSFAMIETKIILAMILRKFKFELSETYVHSPFQVLTLQPKFGMPMNLLANQ